MKEGLAKLKNHVLYGRDFLLDLIFPDKCLGCGKLDTLLCSDCQHKIMIRSIGKCPDCQAPSERSIYCHTCKADHLLDALWVCADYDDPLTSKLIKGLKYRGDRRLARPLADLAGRFIQNNNLIRRMYQRGDFAIIPVPLHKLRKRERGFNQSELIARLLSDQLGLPIYTEVLIRQRSTESQAKLDRPRRLSNVKDAFAWQGKQLEHSNILLIDDVSSTGATLEACAKVLKKQKIREVVGFVIAKN